MPFEHVWLVENRVTLNRMWGDVTLEDLRGSAAQTLARLENSRGIVHEIIDLTQVKTVASQMTEISRFTTPVINHPNMGWIVVYGMQNKLLRFVASMVGQITRAHTRLVDKRADALKTLMHLDPSLTEDLEKLQ